MSGEAGQGPDVPKRALRLLRDARIIQVKTTDERTSLICETEDGKESIAFHGTEFITVQGVREVPETGGGDGG